MRELALENVKLEGRYWNAPTETAVLRCSSVAEFDREYRSKSGADGSVQRSVTAAHRFKIYGVDPGEVRGLGDRTHLIVGEAGKQREFEISSMQLEADCLTVSVH